MRPYLVLLCLLVTACATQPAAVQDKPRPLQQAAKASNVDVLRPVYSAKIHLDLYQKDAANAAIEQAQAALPNFSNRADEQSDLLVEITYLSHGIVTKLYIPSVRGQKRYYETEEVLLRLEASKIEPLEYRLVTFNRQVAEAKLRNHLVIASALLKDNSIDDVSSATVRADQEMDKFYRLLHVRNYSGDAENRLQFHALASEVFLQHHAYTISRDALKQARVALSDVRRANKLPNIVAVYEKRLNEIDEAIKRKDPSFLVKITRTIDGWITGK